MTKIQFQVVIKMLDMIRDMKIVSGLNLNAAKYIHHEL